MDHSVITIACSSKQGVYMGSGIGSLDDVYDTTVAYEKGVRHMSLVERSQC